MLTSNKPLVLNKTEEKEFHAAVSLHIYNSIGGLGRVVHRPYLYLMEIDRLFPKDTWLM